MRLRYVLLLARWIHSEFTGKSQWRSPFWKGMYEGLAAALLLGGLILLALSSPAYATDRHEPPPEPSSAEQAQDQSQAQDQAQSQSQTAQGGAGGNSSNAVDIEWPRVSVVFGMGSPGATSAPVSNGPCPIWVQDKPNRSFPGVGRGATYRRDDDCWTMTQEWMAIQADLAAAAKAQAEAEADRAATERMRAACDDCEVK